MPPIRIVAPFIEEGSLAVAAARAVIAIISEVVVVVVIEATFVESFLEVALGAPAVVVLAHILLILLLRLVLLAPESETTLGLEGQREVNGCHGRVEGLSLWGGERV